MSAAPQASHIPWKKRPATWVVPAILLSVLFGQRAELPADPGFAMDEMRGYRAAANALVAHGCLQLRPLANDSDRRIIDYNPGARCPTRAVFDRYSAASPLGSDRRGLVNERWQIETGPTGDTLLAIRANSHELRFANSENLQWAGNVYFAGGPADSAAQAPMWVSPAELRQTRPCPPGSMVDGKPNAGDGELGQYIQCPNTAGKMVAWQVVAPIQALSEDTGSGRMRYPALASVLRRLEVRGMDGDVISTIERPLQEAMQLRLEAHLRGANTAGKQEKVIRAGILLMDGLTGEIAAAATYPLRAEHYAADPDKAYWAETNFNFWRLQVGSTAKVPFAAAIIAAYPDHARRAPASFPTDFCRNHPSRAKCEKIGIEDPGLSFEDFIKVSSNGHALWLFDNAYRENHTPQSPWFVNLRKFACIEPLAGDGDPSCSGYLWRSNANPALATRGDEEDMLQLEMDDQKGQGLYSGVYVDILGNIRSSWTSANLAQAYARIFTGSAINPRLTRHDGAAPASLEIAPAVWQKVTTGMVRVLGVDGTARELCSAINCQSVRKGGWEGMRRGNLWLFAKTGTSTIIVGDNGKILVLLAARTCDGTAPPSRTNLASLKVIVITQRFEGDGRNAVNLAARLFLDSDSRAFTDWVSRSSTLSRCPA